MEFVDGLKTRRTIRRFLQKEVEVEKIEKVVEIARFAPTWKNSQTVRYVAIYDKDIKNRIALEATLGFEHNKGIIIDSPLLVVELTLKGKSGYEKDGSFTTSKKTHWESFDAGIAAQTFCLACHSEGLGAVIMGIFDEKIVKDILSLDEAYGVSCLLSVGYPNEEPIAPKRKEVEELLLIK